MSAVMFSPATIAIIHEEYSKPTFLGHCWLGRLQKHHLCAALVRSVESDHLAMLADAGVAPEVAGATAVNWAAILAAIVQLLPSILAIIAAFGGTVIPPTPPTS